MTDQQEQKKVEDFIANQLKHGATQQAFDDIAHYLLCSCVLMAGKEKYRLTEIEFYCHENNKNSAWRDGDKGSYKKDSREKEKPIIYAFKHKNSAAQTLQQEMGHFYLHGSGVDFTFGQHDVRWGGILLRGIAKLSNEDEEIEGPWKVRQEIAAALKEQNIKVEKKIWDGYIYLVPCTERKHSIFQGPRWNIWDQRKLLRYTTILTRCVRKKGTFCKMPF